MVLLGLILFFALFARLFRLNYPNQMYFDEVYHVPSSMLLSEGDFQTPFDPEQASYDGKHTADWLHPPLAKYLQAGSMALLGKTPLAWRLPSVGFGLISMLTFYFLLRLLGQNFFFRQLSAEDRKNSAVNLALLGTFLFSLDGLFLVMSRLAMNDVFALAWVLLAVLIYVWRLARGRSIYLLLVGVMLGLALATKWSAWWLIVVLLLHELGRCRFLAKVPFIFFAMFVTPLFIYLLSYLPALLGGVSLADFWTLQKTILLSQLNNPNTHLYSSDPLTWPLNWRPVWFFVAPRDFLPTGFVANIYALANPLLGLYGLAALLLAFMTIFARGRMTPAREMVYLLLTLYLANLLPWIFFKRPLFLHHYLLATPFLLMLVAYFAFQLLSQITDQNARRAWFFNFLFWPFLVFVIFYPHWVALPVPESFVNAVYFWWGNWR